jgi:hypothetical protein
MTGGPSLPPPTASPGSDPTEQMPFPVRTSAVASPLLSAGQLLEAMEGVAYLTDLNATILAVGKRGWSLFAVENAVPWYTADAVIGTSLFDAIDGDELRNAYRRLHAAVVARRRAETVFEYRCDSPIAERHMRMSITAVTGESGVVAVLYQSQMLAEVRRLPMPLFSADLRASQHRPPAPDRLVALCSFCQRVAWPPEADARPRRWISAAEYYRRGGRSDAVVSDGICPACMKRVVEPNV